MVNIYAIVVTYNGAKWVDKCFGSLVNSSIPIKILAIDNGSTDGTTNLIREKFPQVEVIETGTNLGFGKANNIGLKRVLDEKADYAFLLNQDAWVEKDTVEKLVKIHNKHKEFGILSPVPYNGKGDDEDFLFKKYYKKTLITKTEYSNKTFKIKFINAACWLLPLATIKIIGGFDPIFPHYGEDWDYIQRTIYHNFLIGISTKTKYFHARKQKSQTPLKKANRQIIHFTALIKSPLNKTTLEIINFYIFFLKKILTNISNAKNYLYIILNVTGKIPSIINNKRISKRKNPSFL